MTDFIVQDQFYPVHNSHFTTKHFLHHPHQMESSTRPVSVYVFPHFDPNTSNFYQRSSLQCLCSLTSLILSNLRYGPFCNVTSPASRTHFISADFESSFTGQGHKRRLWRQVELTKSEQTVSLMRRLVKVHKGTERNQKGRINGWTGTEAKSKGMTGLWHSLTHSHWGLINRMRCWGNKTKVKLMRITAQRK